MEGRGFCSEGVGEEVPLDASPQWLVVEGIVVGVGGDDGLPAGEVSCGRGGGVRVVPGVGRDRSGLRCCRGEDRMDRTPWQRNGVVIVDFIKWQGGVVVARGRVDPVLDQQLGGVHVDGLHGLSAAVQTDVGRGGGAGPGGPGRLQIANDLGVGARGLGEGVGKEGSSDGGPL